MTKIQTVTGDIAPSELGFTYSHEHLWCVPPEVQKDRDFELSNYESSLTELKNFKEAGGNSLVEASTIDYGRDPEKLKKMSEEAGVNVICVSGFNKGIYFPDWVTEWPVEKITELIVKDVTEGIENTGIKAGFVKSGTWYNVITPAEEKALRAVARAQKITGCPMWTHTEAGTMGLEQLDIMEEEGLDLSRVVIGHSDRNADPWYHLEIVKRGANIQFDGCGKIKYYPDNVRVECIKRLLDAGYVDRLFISGDMGRQSYLHGYGGGPGFRYIIQKFIPRLLSEGVSQQEIDQIFVENPARWLAF